MSTGAASVQTGFSSPALMSDLRDGAFYLALGVTCVALGVLPGIREIFFIFGTFYMMCGAERYFGQEPEGKPMNCAVMAILVIGALVMGILNPIVGGIALAGLSFPAVAAARSKSNSAQVTQLMTHPN